MTEATVRATRPDEAEAIRSVDRAACHAAYDDIHGPETVDELFDAWWSVEDLREGAIGEDGILLVAARDDDVLGMADATPDPGRERVFRIARLYVHPDEWGEGLGTRLVDELRERLPAEVELLRLVVRAESEMPISFYESCGFERVGEHVEESGGETHQEYVYELAVRSL